MNLPNLTKTNSSPLKVYKSELFIFAIFIILSIPGLINLLWFSKNFQDELYSDFEARCNNTHHTIVLLFQNQSYLTDYDLINSIRFKDIYNSYIYFNDSLLFVLNKDSNKFNKQSLDSLWRLGLNSNYSLYTRRTKLLDKNNQISIYTVFDMSQLKKNHQYFNTQIWIKAGFIFIVFIVLFIFISLSLLKPIRKLSAEINSIVEGNERTKLSYNYSFSEINNIAKSINTLIEKKESKEKKVIEEIQGLIDYLTSRNEELEYAKNNAENANKYKTEFLANISHEIRTPLNAILGFTEQLINSEPDETRRYYLNVIKNAGRTLISLVNDILDISKIESGRIEINKSPIHFNSIIQEISDLYSTKALSKGLIFVIDNDLNIPENIMLDDLRLRQVLINLISNAIKFTENGSITLTTKLLKLNPAEGTINISISVKDTGIGINKDYKKLIFEPFTQQEGQSYRKYGGTGLGLPIAKKLVELMGGRIELESEEGKGSEFVVYLYDVEIVGHSDFKINERHIFFEFNLAKILIFDQNNKENELLENIIQHPKLIIYQVDNYEDFVKYCNNEDLNLVIFCCVSNNLKKDKINGIIEITNNKNIPIIAIKNDYSDNIELDNIRAQFASIIQKPVHRQLLLSNIAKILNPSESINNTKESSTDEITTLWNQFIQNANPIIVQKIRENLSEKAAELSNKLVLSQIKEFAEEFAKFTKKADDQSLTNILELLQENINKFQLNTVKKIITLISKI